MSPPIHKDWWLAAALTGATLPAALGQPATVAGRQSGVVTSVTQGPGGAVASAPIYIDGTRQQRLSTGPNQSLHVLFSDQSAITLGPNSELMIAEYRYDNQAKDGRLLVEMTKGFLRVVGGFISKKRETTIITHTATIGIRGGISLIEDDEKGSRGTFLFGHHMQFDPRDGGAGQVVNRPGFGLDATPGGISPPHRVPPNELARQLAGFGGPPPPPSQPPGENFGPDEKQQVKGIAPDRVGKDEDSGPQVKPPTLADILGSQSPGNQS